MDLQAKDIVCQRSFPSLRESRISLLVILRSKVVTTVFLIGVLLGTADLANSQDAAALKPKSGAAAFGLSLLVPGLGHRYVNDGHWGGAGTVFLTADLTLWIGLATTIAQKNHATDAYGSIVAMKSGNTLEGKNRAFELALASYDNSNEYIDAILRSRQWDRLDSAQDPANQWDWESDADRERYSELRDDADTAGQRKTALIGALIVNRLISGVTAALSSRKTRQAPQSFSAGLGYSRYSEYPTAVFALRF
jgi:hypothetical protein